jgi:predicted transposase/invertase (TIGR01784 family)
MGALARKIEQQGIEKGIEKNKAEVAKSMLAEGSDVNFISKVTKLTVEEINDLKAQK